MKKWASSGILVGSIVVVAVIMAVATVLNTEKTWAVLVYAFASFVAIAVGVFFLIVALRMIDGTIDLSNLISEADGKASLSRFQFLIFTFVIASSLLIIIFSATPPAFPNNISPDVLALLGISGGSYLVSKGIQTARDTQLAPGQLQITTASPLPGGIVNTPYSQSLAASGGKPPYSWSFQQGALDGLAWQPTGSIVGTPTTSGPLTFMVQVSDSAQATAQQTFTIDITPFLSIATTSPLPGGIVNTPYSQTLAASGGTSPYSWSLLKGRLPDGLEWQPVGNIGGKPRTAETANFTVQVTDSAGLTAPKDVAITVTAG